MAELFDNHIALLIDLLGFSEFSSIDNSTLQQHVLSLLKRIASMRSDFELNATAKEDWGSVHNISPSVSSFSDHIIISLPVDRIKGDQKDLGEFAPALALLTLWPLVTTIATASLRLGFLIRGGMSYGKLYHSGGVVFGPALVDAAALESKSAIYPRIVLSESAVDILSRIQTDQLTRDHDGMMCLNYYQDCLTATILSQGRPNPNWFSGICKLIEKNLRELSGTKRAKWFYFARKLADASNAMPHDLRMKFHVDPSELPRLE